MTKRLPILELLAAAACLAGLTGCGGSDPAPLSASTATAGPAQTALSVPALPKAAQRHTSAGAAAFMKHYWDVFNHGLAIGDVSALMSISDADCDVCIGSPPSSTDSAGDLLTTKGGYLTPLDIAVERGEMPGALLVKTAYRQAPWTILRGDGSEYDSGAATTGTANAVVRWRAGHWSLAAVVFFGPEEFQNS